MSDTKKYLDKEGVKTFWERVKEEVKTVPVVKMESEKLMINNVEAIIPINSTQIDDTCK